MFVTYRYRIRSKSVKELIRYSSIVNFVWNFLVTTQKKHTQNNRLSGRRANLSKFDFQVLTKGASKDLGIHAHTIQNVCHQFVKSRDTHAKTPKYRKSISPNRSLGWVPFQQQSRQISLSSVTYLGKEYKLFGTNPRSIPSTAKGGCFVEDSRGRWYVCFQVEVTKDADHGKGRVGLDLGLKTLATTSDGKKIENVTSYRKLEGKLKIADKSSNKERAKAIHSKIKNVRQDHLHKESSRLVKENELIVVGNVNPTGLVKTRMAKSVLDASWGGFKAMLRYKASRHGVKFLEVDERNTSQTCSTCGSLPESRPRGIAGLGIREWVCTDCGAAHDRDVNAAKNILMIGQSALPLAEESRIPEMHDTSIYNHMNTNLNDGDTF